MSANVRTCPENPLNTYLSKLFPIAPTYRELLQQWIGAHEVTLRDIEEEMKNLLTVVETAEALNVKVATIRAWLLRRKLPRVNCGRAVRIPAEAVAQFIERNTVPARDERR